MNMRDYSTLYLTQVQVKEHGFYLCYSRVFNEDHNSYPKMNVKQCFPFENLLYIKYFAFIKYVFSISSCLTDKITVHW